MRIFDLFVIGILAFITLTQFFFMQNNSNLSHIQQSEPPQISTQIFDQKFDQNIDLFKKKYGGENQENGYGNEIIDAQNDNLTPLPIPQGQENLHLTNFDVLEKNEDENIKQKRFLQKNSTSYSYKFNNKIRKNCINLNKRFTKSKKTKFNSHTYDKFLNSTAQKNKKCINKIIKKTNFTSKKPTINLIDQINYKKTNILFNQDIKKTPTMKVKVDKIELHDSLPVKTISFSDLIESKDDLQISFDDSLSTYQNENKIDVKKYSADKTKSQIFLKEKILLADKDLFFCDKQDSMLSSSTNQTTLKTELSIDNQRQKFDLKTKNANSNIGKGDLFNQSKHDDNISNKKSPNFENQAQVQNFNCLQNTKLHANQTQFDNLDEMCTINYKEVKNNDVKFANNVVFLDEQNEKKKLVK
ncbi:hypothetical protein GVAV_002631 [Gurleya vavrai]